MKSISRSEAINLLRQKLTESCDNEHSLCEVAAQKGIFCHGFSQFSTRDLFKKYDWLVKKLKIKSRAELEKYISLWQMSRQEVHGTNCACDVENRDNILCHGWDTFSDAQLSTYVRDLTGEELEIGNAGHRVDDLKSLSGEGI